MIHAGQSGLTPADASDLVGLDDLAPPMRSRTASAPASA